MVDSNVPPASFTVSPALVLTEDSTCHKIWKTGSSLCRVSRSCTKITYPLRQGADESSEGQPPRQGVQRLRLILQQSSTACTSTSCLGRVIGLNLSCGDNRSCIWPYIIGGCTGLVHYLAAPTTKISTESACTRPCTATLIASAAHTVVPAAAPPSAPLENPPGRLPQLVPGGPGV
jgi:hypothetical protein